MMNLCRITTATIAAATLAVAALAAPPAAFAQQTTSGTILRTINNPDPKAGEFFGTAVARINGKNIGIACPNDSPDGLFRSGALYLYSDVTSGSRKVQSPVPGDMFRFGSALAPAGRFLAVGEPGTTSSASGIGAVHILKTNGKGDIVATQTLAFNEANNDADFGAALAVRGKNLYIGAPLYETGGFEDVGAVFFGDRKANSILGGIPSPTLPLPGAPFEDVLFGQSVAVKGKRLLVGAPFFDGGTTDTIDLGRAYEYATTALQTGIIPLRVFDNDQGTTGRLFGSAVIYCGPDAVVGFPGADIPQQGGGPNNNPTPRGGMVYVYKKGSVTPQALRLPRQMRQSNSLFGAALAVKGPVLLVGAPGYNQGQGAVFAFNRAQNYKLIREFYFPEAVQNDVPLFGMSITPFKNRLIVGAPGRRVSGVADAGAVYDLLYNAK